MEARAIFSLKGVTAMEQEKIGRFIAENRKAKGFTQIEFAEKLGVSKKSVSRWETGKNMPDVSLFLPICDVLDISVNELIIGERITTKENKKADEILVETIKASNKKAQIRTNSDLYIGCFGQRIIYDWCASDRNTL